MKFSIMQLVTDCPNNIAKFLIKFFRDGLLKAMLINGLYKMNCQSQDLLLESKVQKSQTQKHHTIP